jgi:mono/diheme cytochrome c family protein
MNAINGKTRLLASSFLLASALAAGCSARRSEPIAGPLPDTSPEVARGGIAFDRHCSHCHPGGERGLAPALNDKPLPGFLIRFQVRHGAGAMPAFPRQTIDDQELDDIVRYLKALRRH